MKRRTKKQRQQWWDNLTVEQKAEQVKKWQGESCEKTKALEYNSEFPWLTEGVNGQNKKQWLAAICRKNPWLQPIDILETGNHLLPMG